MEELTNLGENLEELGSLAENLNPAEEIVSGMSDSVGQVAEQAQDDIGSLFGG